jgi:hypothetical protein
MEEEVGRVLDSPSRWVRAEWDEPDLIGTPVEGLDGSCMTFLYELSDDGVVLRAIELMGESAVPVGASSLAEFWQAGVQVASGDARAGGVRETIRRSSQGLRARLGRLPACRDHPGRVRARLAHQPPVPGAAPT